MEKDSEIFDIKPKNMFVPMTVVQAVCIGVILIVVLIIKFVSASGFEKLQEFCNKNILEPTHVSDVFDGEDDSEI